MGCWNKTCGLTGLPIFAGDPVYVFVLQENTDNTERCYSTAFWRPVLVPFYSVYNDYGAGEDSSGIALPILMNGISKSLIEMEQGENKYHDIAVKKEDFNDENFFEVVHEGRLSVENYRGPSIVDFVMFRKDAVDYILDNNVQEIYVGDGKGTCGWDNNYISVKFSDILTDLDKFINRNSERIKSSKFMMPDMLVVWRDDPNFCMIDRFLTNRNYQMSSIVDPGLVLIKMIKDNQIESSREFLIDWLKGSYLNTFMGLTRKCWMPGAHEGSQSDIGPEYTTLIGAIQMGIDTRKEEYREDDDDFEETSNQSR